MNDFKKKYFSLFLLLLILSLGAVFTSTQAQGLETEYPQVLGAETPITTKTPLPEYIKYIFNFSVWLAGFITFGTVFYGGVRYLTSAGSASVTSEAKKQIFAGILGLIILLSSYIILNTINPQLLFFNIPKPDFGTAPPVVVPPPLIEQTLFAEEIPLGALIDGIGEMTAEGSITSPIYTYEGVLAKTRLERITKISEEIWDASKQIQGVSDSIKNTSQKIVDLTHQCSCSYCHIIHSCLSCKSCGGCNCSNNIKDPCPEREEIQKQQKILNTKAAELPPLKVSLESLAEKLNIEKGKLTSALTELEKAEMLTKTCPSSVTAERKTNVLLSYSDFWSYKEGLEEEKIVKKVEIRKTWKNISADSDETTFYCAETPFEVSSIEEASQNDINELLSQIENTSEPRLSCEITIPIGESVDYSEDIANRLIGEFSKTLDNIVKIAEEMPIEKTNAEKLAELPNECKCSYGCSCRCVSCCCCKKDCCCECDPSPCEGSPCPFGDIDEVYGAIQENHQKITDAFNNVTISDDEIHSLIKGDEVHNKKLIGPKREPSWAYDIINRLLLITRNGFRGCVNLSGDWTGALSGEKIMTKNVLMCNEAKDTCWDLEEGYTCYGEDDPDAFPNYFCGEIESK